MLVLHLDFNGYHKGEEYTVFGIKSSADILVEKECNVLDKGLEP